MDLPRVRINTACADEISQLYDIGPHRAQQIVAYRDAHGPLQGPADLAKVKNIPAKLAYTLSPHIDWKLPRGPEPPKQRNWSNTLFWATIFMCLLLISLLLAFLLIVMGRRDNSMALIQMIAASAGIGSLLCFCAYAGLRACVAFVQDRQLAQRLARWALGCMALALFVGIPILAGSVWYWWRLVTPEETPTALLQQLVQPSVSLFALLLLYMFMVPQFIVWWQPHLAESRLLAAIFDVGFGLSGVGFIIAIRSGVGAWPWWILLLSGMAGVVVITVSIVAVRRGESFFQATLDFLDVQTRRHRLAEANRWRYWIAVHLPDPEQQQLVQSALNDMYRPARVSGFFRYIILGFGWWLLITAAEAIVELYVQDLWTGLLN